jgi:predicted alpha/beta-hydrolase family hydrolase
VSLDLLRTGPTDGPRLVLAHGAGAAMDSDWMNRICDLLAAREIGTVRFEFGYMAARRTGGRKPPPKAETLVGEYRAVLSALEAGLPPVIGGKSMGGRVASLVAEEAWRAGQVSGLACLGYPFHPPEKPTQLRTAHLADLTVPTLICQGTRDPFGTRDEVPGYALPREIELSWIVDGDHDLKPRKSVAGFGFKEALDRVADRLADFVRRASVQSNARI